LIEKIGMKYLLLIVILFLSGLKAIAQVPGAPFMPMPTLMASSTTFSFTGATQSWVVPAGTTSITVDARGAQGGGTGGNGGRIQCTIATTPGQTLYFFVGGQPSSNNSVYGFGGAGGSTTNTVGKAGGGLAAIGTASTLSQATALVIAGGGGGASGGNYTGGNAGGANGSRGSYGNYAGTVEGGAGASQSAGGSAGQVYDVQYFNPTVGTAINGGTGGGVGPNWVGGGGGGAGYFGGGGGAGGGASNGAGGGGSSWAVGTATGVTNTAGFNTGNGSISITFMKF
jgi:hypothetical protein